MSWLNLVDISLVKLYKNEPLPVQNGTIVGLREVRHGCASKIVSCFLYHFPRMVNYVKLTRSQYTEGVGVIVSRNAEQVE
jgi:hypothetical protein